MATMRLLVALGMLFTLGPSAGAGRFLTLPGLPISSPAPSSEEEEGPHEDTSSKSEAETPPLSRATGRPHASARSHFLPLPLTVPASPLSRIDLPSPRQPADALRNGLGTHYRC
jgi:hypothetical protein